MMKKQLLIASIAVIVAGGGFVGLTHAESNDTETNSEQTFTGVPADQQGNMDDSQQGNMDNSQQGNVEDNQQGNVDDSQVIWNMT